MGCGKSTLRNELALPGHDFDDEILRLWGEKNETMGQLIDRLGWERFRQYEFNHYQEILSGKNGLYSLGGGHFSEAVFPWIWPDGENEILIWLKTDPELCWKRVSGDENRPLVKAGKGQFLKLYREREELYQKANKTFEDTGQAKEFILDAFGCDL